MAYRIQSFLGTYPRTMWNLRILRALPMIISLGCLSIASMVHAIERLPIERYSDANNWQYINEYLPSTYRAEDGISESAWNWQDNTIHLDRFRSSTAPAKLILIHSIGSHGRTLSQLIGRAQAPYFEVLSPDLPGFGLSKLAVNGTFDYQSWLEMLSDLILKEQAKDNRPIFLVGIGTGGMLAYHLASINDQVNGVITTGFADTSNPRIRRALSSGLTSLVARPAAAVLGTTKWHSLPFFPQSTLTTRLLTPNKKLNHAIHKDALAYPYLPIGFINSYLDYTSQTPETFNAAPILLLLPEADQLVSPEDHLKFYHRLQAANKQLVMIPTASFLPIEADALTLINEHIRQFVQTQIQLEKPTTP